MRYIHIWQTFFPRQPQEYVCGFAKTPEEAKSLIEAGYSYECEFGNIKIFKKPKMTLLGSWSLQEGP